MIKAPWTTEQVSSLRHRQREDSLHPYTCGKCGMDLHAVSSGWKCPMAGCDYQQDWAHTMDVDGSWRKLVKFRTGLNSKIDHILDGGYMEVSKQWRKME